MTMSPFSLTRYLIVLSFLIFVSGIPSAQAETSSTQAVLTFIVLPNSTNMNAAQSSAEQNAHSPYTSDTMTTTLVRSASGSRQVWISI